MQSFLDLIRDFRIQARKGLIHLLWTGQERTILSVRPFVLFRECNCKASGTLIIPVWHPAPFWPMISVDGVNFSDFVIIWMDIPSSKEAFTPARWDVYKTWTPGPWTTLVDHPLLCKVTSREIFGRKRETILALFWTI